MDPLGALGHIQRPAPLMGLADPGGGVAEEESEIVPAAWSDMELLREKDFARYTEAEMALARELIARSGAAPPDAAVTADAAVAPARARARPARDGVCVAADRR